MRRRLLDDDVGVGAADAERVEAGAPRHGDRAPAASSSWAAATSPSVRCTSNGTCANGICGFGCADVTRRHDACGAELQQDLDQAQHARARFQVADVRLDRPDARTRCSMRARRTSRSSGSPYASVSPRTSIGSPRRVPVPWSRRS